MIKICLLGRAMTKSSKEQIKKDETKVLTQLQQHSKDSIDTIAKHCGFSRQKVIRIIHQLEENRLIWGYTAIVDDGKKDMTHFIMLIKRTGAPIDNKIMDTIDTMQLEDLATPHEITIESSCFVHGNYDWIISFTTKDLNQAKRFCNFLCDRFPGIIEKIDLQQTLYFVRKHYIFNPDRKKLHDLM